MIEEWIEKLKVGDEIICGYPGTGDIIKTVKRITKETITLSDDMCFSKKTRRLRGGFGARYNKPYINEATPERVARIREADRRREMIYKLTQDIVWGTIKTETLEEICNLVDAGKYTEKV